MNNSAPSLPSAELADEPQEPCPTPLSWQQVVEAFRADSRPWKLNFRHGTLHGRSWGDGPPLYLLSPLLGDSELFSLAGWLLKDDFRLILVDGLAAPASRYGPGRSLDALADLLAVIADEFGDEQFHLLGASFGAAVALTALLRMPERVGQAVLLGAFARKRFSMTERLLMTAGCSMPGQVRQLPWWSAIERQNHRRWFPPFDFSRWDFYLQNAGQTPVRTLARRSRLLQGWDVRHRLGEIRNPTLVVGCEGEGRIAAAAGKDVAAGIPGARSEWLHHCGTLSFLTHPHRVAKLVRGFLLDQPAAEPRDAHPARTAPETAT